MVVGGSSASRGVSQVGGGVQPVGGCGVLHDNNNDDADVTPQGRPDIVALGLITLTNADSGEP